LGEFAQPPFTSGLKVPFHCAKSWQLDYLEEAMERVSAEIAQRLQDEQTALELLDTIPGVGQRAAEIILAEIGTELSRFPTAQLCPI
jgi:transposase